MTAYLNWKSFSPTGKERIASWEYSYKRLDWKRKDKLWAQEARKQSSMWSLCNNPAGKRGMFYMEAAAKAHRNICTQLG